ncbi:MAG: hypothetical protein ACMV1D_08970 [Macromonas sp.]
MSKATLAQVTQVVAYRTADGQLHATQAEANAHSARLSFIHWYRHNPLGTDEAIVSGNDLVDWLNDNSTSILEFFLTTASPEIRNASPI